MWKPVAAGLAVLVALLAVGCGDDRAGAADGEQYTEERSEEIAREFVKDEATFRWDGMEETLELATSEPLRCPGCWAFVYRYESAHGGYGDRTDQVVTQVITPHEARVVVERYEVTGGVLDGAWDMLKQAPVR